jgi:N-acetylneuraminic acid mutarotase
MKRDHTSLVFDASSNSLLVFGGRVAESIGVPALNDLWRYSLQTQQWQELPQLSTHRPESRYLHSAAFVRSASSSSSFSNGPSSVDTASSSSGGVLVVFGGEHIDRPGSSKKDHKLNDLWAYSTVTKDWVELVHNDCTVRLQVLMTTHGTWKRKRVKKSGDKTCEERQIALILLK